MYRWLINRTLGFKKFSPFEVMDPQIIALDSREGESELSPEASEIRDELSQLLESDFTEEEIHSEGMRYDQRRKDESEKLQKLIKSVGRVEALRKTKRATDIINCTLEQESDDEEDIGSDERGITLVDENPVLDSNLDDIMSVFDSDEEEDGELLGRCKLHPYKVFSDMQLLILNYSIH